MDKEEKKGAVGKMTKKSTRRVLGDSLFRLFVHSFIHLLCTARALRCSHSPVGKWKFDVSESDCSEPQ